MVGGQNTREYRIYERDVSTKFEWQANKEQFNRLDPWFKKNVKDSIKKNGKTIAKIKTGAVVVLSAYVRMYTPKSLSKLFQNHGFNIVTTFLTTRKGHLVHDFSKAFEEGHNSVSSSLKNSAFLEFSCIFLKEYVHIQKSRGFLGPFVIGGGETHSELLIKALGVFFIPAPF